MNKLIKLFLAGLVTAIFMVPAAWAGNVTIPNTFTSGTPAVAAEVNSNFGAVETAVDDNDGRITTHSGSSSAHHPDASGLVPRAWANSVDGSGATLTSNAAVDMNTLTINAPSDGILLINASVHASNSNTVDRCLFRTAPTIDGSYIYGTFSAMAYLETANNADWQALSFTAATPILTGTHTITHQVMPLCGASPNISYYLPVLSVVFYPASQGTIAGAGVIPPAANGDITAPSDVSRTR